MLVYKCEKGESVAYPNNQTYHAIVDGYCIPSCSLDTALFQCQFDPWFREETNIKDEDLEKPPFTAIAGAETSSDPDLFKPVDPQDSPEVVDVPGYEKNETQTGPESLPEPSASSPSEDPGVSLLGRAGTVEEPEVQPSDEPDATKPEPTSSAPADEPPSPEPEPEALDDEPPAPAPTDEEPSPAPELEALDDEPPAPAPTDEEPAPEPEPESVDDEPPAPAPTGEESAPEPEPEALDDEPEALDDEPPAPASSKEAPAPAPVMAGERSDLEEKPGLEETPAPEPEPEALDDEEPTSTDQPFVPVVQVVPTTGTTVPTLSSRATDTPAASRTSNAEVTYWPIIAGACLVGLLLILLIAFVVLRRRKDSRKPVATFLRDALPEGQMDEEDPVPSGRYDRMSSQAEQASAPAVIGSR